MDLKKTMFMAFLFSFLCGKLENWKIKNFWVATKFQLKNRVSLER